MKPSLWLAVVLTLFVGPALPSQAELASQVANLAPETGPNRSSHPQSFTEVGSRVVFFAMSDGAYPRPWTTDGTPEGTASLPGGPLHAEVGAVDGVYLWFSRVSEVSRETYSLWASDGRALGTTRLVDDVYRPRDNSFIPWVRAADHVFFFRKTEAFELWESDGTAAGTRRIASLPQVEHDVFSVALHRRGIFFVTREIVPLHQSSHPYYRNQRLWRTDRYSGRTRLLHHVPGDGSQSLQPTTHKLLFFPGERVWATDGTVAGTTPLDGPLGEAAFEPLWYGGAVAGGRLYLEGTDPVHGQALWMTDGTGTGTRLLAPELSLRSGVWSVGDRHVFVATDQAHGTELWSTRGTPATTGLVADIHPGPWSGLPLWEPRLAVAGERIFLTADDGVHGTDLWVSDGTPGGTHRLLDLGPDGGWFRLHSEGDEVFVYRRDAEAPIELWASDGTPAGTRRLTGFAAGPGFGPAPSLAELGPWIVTLGYDPRGRVEPWVLTRGGQEGQPLGDLATGGEAAGSNPFDATALGDRLLFITEGDESATVWVTRGSADTTIELPVPVSPYNSYDPPSITVVGDLAYLDLGDLWASDGTPAGTRRLTDFATIGPGGRLSTEIVGLGGRAVFGVHFDGFQGVELWTSDGTPEGTHRIDRVVPKWISDLTVVGDALYFWGNDGVEGWEIWTADVALDDVRRLTDHTDPDEPGPQGEPPRFTRIGAWVYFLVSERSGGRSLWRTDGTAQGTERVLPPVVGDVEVRPQDFAGANGKVVLLAFAPNGYGLRLWTGDGSGSAWTQLHDFGPGSSLEEVVPRSHDVLLLVRERQLGDSVVSLYRSDGTAAGTFRSLDFSALGVGEVHAVTPVGGRLFFSAGPRGYPTTEPWISAGTLETTRRLQDIVPGAVGSEPEGFVQAGSRLYFTADDGLHGRELWSLPLDGLEAPCQPSATALCLGNGRFRVELFRHDQTGDCGDGRAVHWSSSAGMFWFYDYGNPEAVVKMVDGGVVNGRHWLFFGPLGNAHMALTVTDLLTGDSRRYPDQAASLPVFADTAAFSSHGAPVLKEPGPERLVASEIGLGAAGSCRPTPTRLCLHDGRFAVELAWRDVSGAEWAARSFSHGDRAGYFTFYGDLQAAVKILDGRAINGRFWLFATSVTHLEDTLTVTDTTTGLAYRYPKAFGEFSSVIDLTSLR